MNTELFTPLRRQSSRNPQVAAIVAVVEAFVVLGNLRITDEVQTYLRMVSMVRIPIGERLGVWLTL